MSEKVYHRDKLACGSQAFHSGRCFFDPSMSALPIIVKQNSPRIGLFHPLTGKRELGLDRRETG